MRPLLIATTNPGKLAELFALLGDLPIQFSSLAELQNPPAVAEDAPSYAGNALRKATALARWSGRAAPGSTGWSAPRRRWWTPPRTRRARRHRNPARGRQRGQVGAVVEPVRLDRHPGHVA
jgi:hypothetical protein